MTDFFPGLFDDATPAAVLQDTPPPAKVVPVEPERPRFDYGAAWRMRVQVFACSLSRARRAEVERRPRFHSMPWLRRADDLDPDDQLP